MSKHRNEPARPVFIRDTEPLALDMKVGKYFWCSCGRTARVPFCDGSHHKTGLRPYRVLIEKAERVYWCQCKHSRQAPYCDGSHAALRGQEGRLAEK